MELTQLLAIHGMLVKLFLGFLVAGIAIAFIPKQIEKLKKMSFIYTMIFQLIATLVLITGLYALYLTNWHIGITEIIMIVVWALMMFIEIKKHKAIKMSTDEEFRSAKSGFLKVSIIQILLIALTVALMVMKAKGVVAI